MKRKKKRVYISGPITNDPDYLNKFNTAEIDLIGQGYESVVNPAAVNRYLPDDFTHEDYMRVSLAELRCCEVIYLLDGWRTSQGAKLEHAEAIRQGMEIMFQVDPTCLK